MKTSTPIKKSLKSKLERLRRGFFKEIPQRLEDIFKSFNQLKDCPDNPDFAGDLHRKIHNIKGTAASFGLNDLSLIATQLEPMLKYLIEKNNSSNKLSINELADTIEEIHQLILQLRQETKKAVESDKPFLDLFPAFELPKASNEVEQQKHKKPLIYICDDDQSLLHQMEIQLGCFSYESQSFSCASALLDVARKKQPDIIIMDIVFPESDKKGLEVINSLQTLYKDNIPIIFISARNDFDARLYALEVGGIAYFNKPFKVTELVDSIDEILFPPTPEPYRVLIIDDDQSIAQYHALILEDAGIRVEIVTIVNQVLDKITKFKPDLLLLDMFMPKCSGPKLAQLIRQIPEFVSLPIVYLSSETNSQNQISALRVGADGFLTKPIMPQRLISEVLLRTERMKVIRSLMIKDSLTGLLNHTTLLNALDNSLQNATRRNEPVNFVMIDIDHFKKVNDQYGHALGDQVILALSRLLRQRFRQTDYVGRYGGEEFALVLPNMQKEKTIEVVNHLRQDFANLKFTASEGVFSCTLSAGLSFFPQLKNKQDIVNRADAALYEAKHKGRNQVMVFDEDISASTIVDKKVKE